MRGVAVLGGAMHGTVRWGEVGCGKAVTARPSEVWRVMVRFCKLCQRKAVVEWRVLVRLVLASFGEARLGRARQSR